MSFPQFNSFPPEIHALILDSCPPNDLTCLRLTCKYLYNFSHTKPQQRIDLEQTDESGPLCCHEVPKDNNYRSRYQHYQECHKLSYEKIRARNEKNGRSTPQMKKCRTRYNWNSSAGSHCECFLRKGRLHYRLSRWVGKGLGYCGTCERFTKRKPQHKGRCFHGKSKPRVYGGNSWTHVSRRGAFGRNLWRKWFNNQAMNRLEKRLAVEGPLRRGSERYDMRKLGANDVNTKQVRDSKSWR